MKALLIDHDDSFTHNLRHWLKSGGLDVEVRNHRDLETEIQADLVVLSPGPKRPEDYPEVLKWVLTLPETLPVYGVCLGMQMLVSLQGGKVKAYSPPLHGKKSGLNILNAGYRELEGAKVARYHSLACEAPGFEILAASDGLPMWIRHAQRKWMGVQFHPESFLTEKADVHLNFLKDWLGP